MKLRFLIPLLLCGITFGQIINPGGGGAGVSSINSTTGAFTFTGSGVSCTLTTCTFSGGSGLPAGTGVVRVDSGTGSAAELNGDVTSTALNAVTVTKINGTALSSLATGILKNTTTTGVPSIAAAGTDYVAPGGALGTPSSGTLTNATGLPLSGVVSATGAIATIANGNHPLTLNCAQTSSAQACVTIGETTAATNTTEVGLQVSTLTTTTAVPFQITQGAAGPANAAAPNLINISAAAAGGASSASNAGSMGAGIGLLTGAGSAGGATTGIGGAGGTFTLTEGAGGAAGGTSTNNGGNGGGFVVTTGVGGNGGSGVATAGSGGPVTFTMGAPGTNSATGIAGADGLFQITGNAPASTSNATGVAAGVLFQVTGVAGGACTGAACTGGIGSAPVINAGIGGSVSGASGNAIGGGGGNVTINGGAGASSLNSAVNSNGGNVILNPGAPGTGGSGTAGKAGVVSVTGPGAGFIGFQQGTAVTTLNTQIPANTMILQAPTSVTAYTRTWAGAAATGFGLWTNSGGTMTETLTPVEGTISAGPALFGSSAVNTVIAQTIAVAAGHFTNLVITSSLGGSCTTAPTFNVFDGTSNTGTAKIATSTTQTKGTATSQSQTLTYAAGDLIGIYISTAGATCTTDTWAVSAEYSTP